MKEGKTLISHQKLYVGSGNLRDYTDNAFYRMLMEKLLAHSVQCTVATLNSETEDLLNAVLA